MNNAGKRRKTSEARGRQVEAMEGKRKPWKGAEAMEEERKPWKRSGSRGRGSEVVEEGRRGWARTRK